MATTVTGGGTTSTSWSADSSWVQTAVTLPSGAVTTAFNGNKPMKITQVRTYVASYDGTGNIVASIGGFSGTYSGVGIDSTPGLSGWLSVSGSFVNGGTSTSFRLNPSTGGGVYFKRSGSGSTTSEGGYTWAGTMYYEYQYIEVPTAPLSFAASASGSAGGVAMSWSAPSDNGGSAVTGYDVYRGTTLIGSTTGTTFSYTAPDSTSYSYSVRAKNAVSTAASTTSVASNAVSVIANFDPNSYIPTGLTATPSATSGEIDLTWTAPANNPAATYGYRIYKDSALLATISIDSNPAESYTATGLTPGVEYDFYVTTIYGGTPTETDPSGTATATAPGFALAPFAVSVTSVITTTVIVSVEVPKQLRLSWTAPDDMTSTGGYKIYRDDVQIAGVGVSGSKIGNMTTPVYIDTDPALVAGTEYTYTIRAYLADSNEVGILSDPVSGIPVSASIQAVTDTVDNLTNAEFAGPYDNQVTVVNSTTFSYPVTGGTEYSVQSVTEGFGTVSGSLLEIFGVDFPIATASSTSFVFEHTSTQPTTPTPVSINATVTDKTNAALSGTYTVHASTTTGTPTVYYSVTGAVLTADIPTIATAGTVSNLDSGVINATETVVSVPTASSFTYELTDVPDQAEASTNGVVLVPANTNIYNAVDNVVTSVPRYDTLVYSTTVPDSGATSEDVDIEFPDETARRTSSTASAEIQYRSGWIG